ncbi:helix-turn-helix domain-containing protein [Mycobacteroides abscessus subsp. abscessus]|uniref:helix-turn-helix domain-containing protein n=1 Tax=Mycobacteroides abscessus TaxID=36809 RepID=UPI00092B6A3C|nr:helix-turn-helix transcriptional regulator [Mycobacteroides abscessus]SHT89637.1 helix-turn-helix domain-containing protein [Mycobacteroides abscessus subsp. abscessus]SLL32990.1 helix-turn-helix domain-containing protein [Mycobacteroides abscessus subsp. abscessus]
MVRKYRSPEETALGRSLGQELQRQRHGRTAEAIAQSAGVSLDTLRRVERGAVASPGFFLVGQIAQVLDVSLDDLFRATKNNAKPEVQSS